MWKMQKDRQSFEREVILFLEIPRFSSNTTQDKRRVASMPKTILIDPWQTDSAMWCITLSQCMQVTKVGVGVCLIVMMQVWISNSFSRCWRLQPLSHQCFRTHRRHCHPIRWRCRLSISRQLSTSRMQVSPYFLVRFCFSSPLKDSIVALMTVRRRGIQIVGTVVYCVAVFVQILESPGILLFRIPGPGKSWRTV